MFDSDQYPFVWQTYIRYLFHSFLVGFIYTCMGFGDGWDGTGCVFKKEIILSCVVIRLWKFDEEQIEPMVLGLQNSVLLCYKERAQVYNCNRLLLL